MTINKNEQPPTPETPPLQDQSPDIAPDQTVARNIEDISEQTKTRTEAEQPKSAELPERTNFFQSKGDIVAYSSEGNKIYISQDGGEFVEQVVSPIGGKVFHIRNPKEENGRILHIEENGIRAGDELFEEMTTPPTVTAVIEIPEDIRIEYKFKLPDGTPLIVTSNANAGDFYGSFKVIIGDRTLNTITARRSRDGGTTTIKTSEGTFHIGPGGDSPTWNDQPLQSFS